MYLKKSYDISCYTISGKLKEAQKQDNNDEKNGCFGRRHLVAVMGFMSLFLLNGHRLVLGVSIVAMIKHTNSTHENISSFSCPIPTHYQNSSRLRVDGDFDWSSELQGYILGAGFFGYMFTQPIAGRLAEIWGAKPTILFGNTLTAVMTFISPFASWWHPYALFTVQFTRGLSQGFILPSTYVSMAKWFPRNERSLLSTLVVCGYSLGAMVGGLLSGWICDLPDLGWPFAFYVFGIISVLFSIFFAIFFYETPQCHPTISNYELKLIEDGQEPDSNAKLPLPWKSILCSVPVYALFIALFGYYWSISYFLSVHPTYLGRILHYPMTENGVFSSLPIFCKFVGGVSASMISNWLQKNNYIGVDKLRKGFNSIGSIGFSACLLGIYFAGCDSLINIILFSLSLYFGGIALSGAMIACVDMTPRFAGTIMGNVSAGASFAQFILPIVVGKLTKHQKLEEWHEVFLISIAIVMISAIVFAFFGSAEVQPWNNPSNQEHKSADDKKEIETNKKTVSNIKQDISHL